MTSAVTDELLCYVEREGKRMPRSVLETLVLGAYQRRAISGGTAARVLEIPLEEFLGLASRAGIAVLDQTAEELASDLRALGG